MFPVNVSCHREVSISFATEGIALMRYRQGWDPIHKPILQFIEEVRAKRLETEYRTMVTTRLTCLKSSFYRYTHGEMLQRQERRVVHAGIADCAFIPEIRTVLEDTSPDVSNESVLASLDVILPDLVARWTRDREAEFAALAVEAFGDYDAARTAAPLDLAIALFVCTGLCYSRPILRYPQTVQHRCFRIRVDASTDRFDQAVISNTGQNPCTIAGTNLRDHIHMDKMRSAIDYAREVIIACGYDPDRVTFAEMEACQVRLRCRICAKVSKQVIYSWKFAVSHRPS